MFEDPLPPAVRQALIDRFEGWEIVELLDLSAEQVIDALADDIAEALPAVKEALGIDADDEERDEDYG